ncbi:hypothetical protein J7K41_03320 [Candidatus Micrarchaeota archaeon]|nr:hypothetical protein [Candidatus Micrarchaeota archaeon]
MDDMKKVLIDKNVNTKRLSKELQKLSTEEYKLYTVSNLENKNKKLDKTVGLLILDGPTRLPGRLAEKDTDQIMKNLKAIIGRENMGDILHVETAIKEKMNYFITNDKDILNKRTKIKEYYPELSILSEEEFILIVKQDQDEKRK